MKWLKYAKYIPILIGMAANYKEAAKDGVIDEEEVITIARKVLKDFDIKIRMKVKPV